MIHSTSSSDRTTRPDAVTPAPHVPPARGPEADRFAAEHSAALRAALARHPEVRPEVVERARALAADPAYPPADVLRRVGEILLGSPDPAAEDN
jgi:hypothetical protein